MRRAKWMSIGAALALCFGIACLYFPETPASLPHLSPRGGSQGVPGEFQNAQRAAGYFLEEIRKHPDLPKNYVHLAQLFQQEARVTGRHHEYIPKAQSLLKKALDLDPNDVEATLTSATVCMSLHQFEKARDLAQSVIARTPRNAFAYGILCDALVELGRYAEAVTACDTMLAIRPDIRSYARASYLRELHGDLDGACAAMQAAAEAGVSGQENRAWALYTLGRLYLQLGKQDTAGAIFRGILEERPEYAFALSGMARGEFNRDDAEHAIRDVTRAAELTPEHLFLEQLADMYLATGREREAAGTARIVLKSFGQHERDGWNVNREFAMFCANHNMNLEEALKRARQDYERRPGNIDALDTYAWVLYTSGEPGAAGYIEQALRLHSRNPDIHYHAAMIYRAQGDAVRAQEHMKLVVAARADANPIYSGQLRAAGSKDLALNLQSVTSKGQ